MPKIAVLGEIGKGVEAVVELRGELERAPSLLVLTGAGVSAESGVPTFRGPEGLWRRYRPGDLATPQAFAANPVLVWEWYAWRREVIAPLVPNPAHRALAQLEERIPDFLLVTQNVDGLHAEAGSRKLVELHGSLWRTRCLACRESREDRRVPLPTVPPRCSCGGTLRPDVVWFGETLAEENLERAFQAAQRSALVLVVGTSSLVHPAAALPNLAREAGAKIAEINAEETPLTRLAHWSLRGKAGEILPSLVPSWVPR